MRSQLLLWILTACLSIIPSKCASRGQRNPRGLSANFTNLRTKQHSSCVLKGFCLPLPSPPSPLPLESLKLNKGFVVDKGIHRSRMQKGGLGCEGLVSRFTHTGELDCELRKPLSFFGLPAVLFWTEDKVIINCKGDEGTDSSQKLRCERTGLLFKLPPPPPIPTVCTEGKEQAGFEQASELLNSIS